MDQKSYQLGGIVLILAALASALGSFLHADQPATLDAYNALGTSWTVSHVSISLSATLLLIGSLFLARHFADTAGYGLALVAAGVLIVGGVAIFALGALETSGFSAAAAEGGVAGQHAFVAISAVMVSMATGSGFLFPVAIAAYGLAMLKDSGWPAWLAWLGVLLGVVGLGLNIFGITPPGPGILGYLNNAWYLVLGVLFMGRGGSSAPAESPAPAV